MFQSFKIDMMRFELTLCKPFAGCRVQLMLSQIRYLPIRAIIPDADPVV